MLPTNERLVQLGRGCIAPAFLKKQTMAKHFFVTVELDDIDTDDLIDELENRYLDESRKAVLMDIVADNDPKIKLFMRLKDQFTLLELEQFFSPQTPINIPENQLALTL